MDKEGIPWGTDKVARILHYSNIGKGGGGGKTGKNTAPQTPKRAEKELGDWGSSFVHHQFDLLEGPKGGKCRFWNLGGADNDRK